MKKQLLFLSFVLSFVACSQSSKKAAVPPVLKRSGVTVPRDPPQAEGKVLLNDLNGGLVSLKGKRILALVIFNLPDGYLIRAKSKMTPPDSATREVLDLQVERIKWLEEALVTNCEGCGEIQTPAPLEAIGETENLKMIDHASLRRAPTPEDIAMFIKQQPGVDYYWVIFASEESEQKRALAPGKLDLLEATSSSEIQIRSYLYEKKTKKLRHSAEVRGWDQEVLIYPLKEVAGVENYDNLKYDPQYPFPLVPEVAPIAQKSLLKLTELLNP